MGIIFYLRRKKPKLEFCLSDFTMGQQNDIILFMLINPERLIPEKLKVLGKNDLIAVNPLIEMGRMDQEYYPELAVVIAEKDTSTPLLAGDDWDRTLLRKHKNAALSQKLLNEEDQPLMSFLGQRIIKGSFFGELFIVHSQLRGSGVAREFYDKLDQELMKIGVNLIYGHCETDESVRFHSKMPHNYFGEQLYPEAIKKLTHIRYDDPKLNIRFFDQVIERQAVKKEFLIN